MTMSNETSKADESIEQALALHQGGQLQQAEQIYRQILQGDPNHVDAMHFLGVLAHQVGRHDVAVQLIGAAVQRGAGAAALNNLGEALRASGQVDRAIAAYRQAIEQEPNYAEAHSNLGLALQTKGQLDEALAAHRRAVELN